MPTYRVTGPDGATYRVTAPEGATEQEVIEYAQKQGASAEPPPAPEKGPQGPPLSRTERFVTGLRDPVVGFGQMMTKILPEAVRGQLMADKNGLVQFNTAMGETTLDPAELDQTIAANEQAYQARRGDTGIDAYRLAGNMAATAPLSAFTPGPGATLAATAVKSGVGGGLTSALQPVTDTDDSFWEQKGEQAAVGAATGAVMGPLFQAVSRMFSPRVDPAVTYLQERGITPRPGQIIGPKAALAEDKAMSLPIVGDKIAEAQRRAVEDFNRAAYNEVLKPLGQKFSGPVGREGFAKVQQTVGKAYDDLLPNIQFKPDRQFTDEFKNLAQMAAELPEERFKQFQTIMGRDLIGRLKNGSMDGKSFKQVEEKLNDFAQPYMASGDADQRSLGAAVFEVLRSARASLERTNPQYAGQLKRINQSYAAFARVRDAASRIGAAEGVFTPDQLLSSSLRMDKSAGKGSFARGDAVMQKLAENAKKVIGVKYPDSGTAGRLAEFGALAGLVANPALTIGGGVAGSLPYTQAGQNIAAKLLTQRSPWARPAGELFNSLAVRGGPVAGTLGVGLAYPPLENGRE